MLQKTKTDSGLTRFVDEITAKILRLNIIGKFELDFAQFTCFNLPIRNHLLCSGSSTASNREFADRVLNAKLVLFT